MNQHGGPRRGGADRGSSYPEEKTLDKLWPEYLKGGYFGPDGNLKPELVSRVRVEPLVREMGRAFPALTSHQLRRFFQHCRAIEARLKARTSWPAEQAAFGKLDVAAADAFGKSPKKIPKLFHDFIQRNVMAVRTNKDFLEGFLPHFEALVGFGAQHLRERERS